MRSACVGTRGCAWGFLLLTSLGFPFWGRGGELDKIEIAADGRSFRTGEGRGFVPFGVTYFRPGQGWAPQVWKRFDESATRRDLNLMRSVGVNCVRVFLSYGSFLTEPGRLGEEGIAKLDRFLVLAEEAGLYVHPTGPDHWEGLPDWARTDRMADEVVLRALEGFWGGLAARYRGRNVIFAYDLLNEPEVGWDSAAVRAKWNTWLRGRYRGIDEVARVWGRRPDADWGEFGVPAPVDAAGDRELLDFQHFREELADEWTRRQVCAIKAADPAALVSTGFIQWSVPVVLGRARQYSGFRPERQAQFLDFLEVHFYPLADGPYYYQGAEALHRNLAYLGTVVTEVARPMKPVVLAEFGWYGGGRPHFVGSGAPEATEEQQAEWGRAVIESTRDCVSGWLHWGFFDHPEARDVTELIGLAREDGGLKAWGRAFQELSAELKTAVPRCDVSLRPALDWDACLTDGAARRQFRDTYWKPALEARP